MMDYLIAFMVGFIIGGVSLFLFSINMGAQAGKQTVMREAFDRGYAVQCIGKTGYYWECE